MWKPKKNRNSSDKDFDDFLKKYQKEVLIQRDDEMVVNMDAARSIVKKSPDTAEIVAAIMLETVSKTIDEGDLKGAANLISMFLMPLVEPLQDVTGNNEIYDKTKEMIERMTDTIGKTKKTISTAPPKKKKPKLGPESGPHVEKAKHQKINKDFLIEVGRELEQILNHHPIGIHSSEGLILISLLPKYSHKENIPAKEVQIMGDIPTLIPDLEKINAESEFKAVSIHRLGKPDSPTSWARRITTQLNAQEEKQGEVESLLDEFLNSKNPDETGQIIMINAPIMDDVFFECLNTLYFSSLMKGDNRKVRQYDTMRTHLPEALSALHIESCQ